MVVTKESAKAYAVTCMDCNFHDKDPSDVYGEESPDMEESYNKRKEGLKHWFFGSLDWAFMCT